MHHQKLGRLVVKPSADPIGGHGIDGLTDIPNISQKGTRLGNWLTREQAKELLAVPDRSTLKGKRDYVILARGGGSFSGLVGLFGARDQLAPSPRKLYYRACPPLQ